MYNFSLLFLLSRSSPHRTHHVPKCELIPDPLQNASLVAEVLKNRTRCFFNSSVTIDACLCKTLHDVRCKKMEIFSNTEVPDVIATPYLSGCFVNPVKFNFQGHKKSPILPYIYVNIVFDISEIMPVSTSTLILQLKRFFFYKSFMHF
jgi:hypothetical protein